MSIVEKPDNEKYVFRFYMTQPSDIRGKDVYIDSPYKEGNGFYYKMGNIINAPDEDPRVKPALMPNYYFNGPKNFSGLLKVPHKGLSVIGLSDPMYSLYRIRELNNMLQSPVNYRNASMDNGKLLVPFVLKRLPEEALREVIENAIYKGIGAVDKEDDFYKADENGEEKDNESELAIAIDKIVDNIKNTDNYNVDTNMVLSVLSNAMPKFNSRRDAFIQQFNDELLKQIEYYQDGYRFDILNNLKPQHGVTNIQSDNNNKLLLNRYDKLLDALYRFYNSGAWGDLYLASVPESALYNINDYAEGKTRGQADFPEELKVHRLRLLRNLDDDSLNLDKTSAAQFTDAYDKWNLPRRLRNHMIGRKRLLNELESLPVSAYETPVEGTKDYNALLKDIDDAKNILAETIGIDPNDVVSDELCKDIWYDLSNYFNKKDRQHNIVNGLSGGDNKWR